METSVFKQRLQSIMSDNKFDRVIRKRKTGKLDMHGLWRVQAGQRNVFKHKQERLGKEYSVVLTVDESGSMTHFGGGGYDTKLEAAADLATYLAENLSFVDFAIVGFNCRVKVHKPLGLEVRSERLSEIKTEIIKSRDARANNKSGDSFHTAQGNHDYEAIETAFRMLSKKDHGKILIHMSDGRPSCDSTYRCDYDEALHDPKKIKALIDAHPGVLTAGVGILDEGCLKDMFKNVIPVDDLETFKSQILTFLQTHIKRG